MRARAVLHQLTPPVIQTAWRRRRSASTWEYVGEHWPDEPELGWDSQGVVDAYRRKLPEFRAAIAAPACIGRANRTRPRLGAGAIPPERRARGRVRRRAGREGRDHISVLDWGGGFGFLSFVIAELFPDLDVDYSVKDVPSVVHAGAGSSFPT